MRSKIMLLFSLVLCSACIAKKKQSVTFSECNRQNAEKIADIEIIKMLQKSPYRILEKEKDLERRIDFGESNENYSFMLFYKPTDPPKIVVMGGSFCVFVSKKDCSVIIQQYQ